MAPKKQPVKPVKKVYDYSGLEKGMRLQVESDGQYYAAEVVKVSTAKNRAKAPVKVSYNGYEGYDEWVGGDSLRSKALKVAEPKKEVKEKKPKEKKVRSKPAEVSELSDEQMATRRLIIDMNQKRLLAFDDEDLDLSMSYFLPEGCEFMVKAPGADDVKMEGFEAIKGLEAMFLKLIKDDFGKCWHELVEWKWAYVGNETAECSVYMRLWLTDKGTGKWKQQDISGKCGRFWLTLKHHKVDGKWFVQSEIAVSED